MERWSDVKESACNTGDPGSLPGQKFPQCSSVRIAWNFTLSQKFYGDTDLVLLEKNSFWDFDKDLHFFIDVTGKIRYFYNSKSCHLLIQPIYPFTFTSMTFIGILCILPAKFSHVSVRFISKQLICCYHEYGHFWFILAHA